MPLPPASTLMNTVPGIGVYVGFMLLGPRFHALGKSRGYMVSVKFLDRHHMT